MFYADGIHDDTVALRELLNKRGIHLKSISSVMRIYWLLQVTNHRRKTAMKIRLMVISLPDGLLRG